MNLPPILVINLVRLVDRRRRLKKALQDYGFTDITWIKAVDGRDLDPKPPYKVEGLDAAKPWPAWVDPYARRAMTMGEVGCALSHIRAWQHIAKNGQPTLVLEDDAVPIDGVIQTLPHLLNDLSYVDFDLVYLAQRNQPPPKLLVGRHVHAVDYQPSWTLAYLISAEAALEMIASPWQTHLCPADEILPAAFGINDKPELNQRFQVSTKRVLSSNQRFFTPQESSESSETEKSVAVADQSVKMTCFTVASDDTPDLERLCLSGARYGVHVQVLGLGKPWRGGNMEDGPGGGQKVNLLRPALKNLAADHPVLFLDGYDTIITRYAGDIIDAWRHNFKNEVVFAAEVTCWPDAERGDDFPVLEDDNPYRFLNSGAFIATAGDLRKLLAQKIGDMDDDQRYYTDRFLGQDKKNMPTIHLDSNCQIFQCLNHALGDVEVDEGRGMIFNRRCESWPAVIHANGPSKDWLSTDGRSVGGRWRKFYGDMTSSPNPSQASSKPLETDNT